MTDRENIEVPVYEIQSALTKGYGLVVFFADGIAGTYGLNYSDGKLLSEGGEIEFAWDERLFVLKAARQETKQ